MTLVYADTSALVHAYFPDESDHEVLRTTIRDAFAVTSEIARLEFASAVATAARAGRVRKPKTILDAFDVDCRPGGPITLIALRTERTFLEAHRLLTSYPLRTLDAIHLAVALVDATLLGGGDVTFVTRDEDQQRAAVAEGLAVDGI